MDENYDPTTIFLDPTTLQNVFGVKIFLPPLAQILTDPTPFQAVSPSV